MNLPLNIDLQQVLLHLLNFTLLLAVLYFLLYKPVKDFMDKRSAEYEDMDKNARMALAEAKAHENEAQARLDEIDEEIRQKKQTARKEMNDAAEAETRKAKEEAAKILAAARNEAENSRRQILGDAKNELSQMVLDATEKIVCKTTSDAYESFLAASESNGDKQ